jgi:hypothetical protein
MPKGFIHLLFLLRPLSRYIISTLAKRNIEAKIKGSKVNEMRNVLFKTQTTVEF